MAVHLLLQHRQEPKQHEGHSVSSKAEGWEALISMIMEQNWGKKRNLIGKIIEIRKWTVIRPRFCFMEKEDHHSVPSQTLLLLPKKKPGNSLPTPKYRTEQFPNDFSASGDRLFCMLCQHKVDLKPNLKPMWKIWKRQRCTHSLMVNLVKNKIQQKSKKG